MEGEEEIEENGIWAVVGFYRMSGRIWYQDQSTELSLNDAPESERVLFEPAESCGSSIFVQYEDPNSRGRTANYLRGLYRVLYINTIKVIFYLPPPTSHIELEHRFFRTFEVEEPEPQVVPDLRKDAQAQVRLTKPFLAMS